ncbi:MAG: hypothetical protein K1X83_13010 [Oligoflexia bacterium]|nr:hypothetical protein [Oligoflexia bacterium]
MNPLDLIFPRRCLVCHRRLRKAMLCYGCLPPVCFQDTSQRCLQCFSSDFQLDAEQRCEACRRAPTLFNSMRFIWNYDERAKNLIHVLKYAPSFRLCRHAGGLLSSLLPRLYSELGWDLVVPLPSSAHSLTRRGFNQCAVMAKVLERALPTAEYRPQALAHPGRNPPQASLRHADRLGNIKAAFRARASVVEGKRILLLDDVITTGATAQAAGIALLDGGAYSVDLIALARSSAWQEFRERLYHER